jgi:ATP-binding cassette subfamily B protein
MGGLQALQDPTRVGVIVEFVIYINMLTFPVSAIGWTASMIQRAAASQKRLNQFLDIQEAVASPNPSKLPTANADIVFDNVNFVYNHTGIKALSNFSLTIKKGEKVLVLGKTGSGKSTLAQLLLRFYDPTSGQISMGGVPLNQFDLQALRHQISYVQQDVFLFSDTVADNISFGSKEPVGMDAIVKAATLAAVDQEIMGFEKGYDTLIGERGVTLSGGQKQRVAIARALINNPSIIMGDEPTGNLDSKNADLVFNILKELTQSMEMSMLIVTHDSDFANKTDRVITMADGEIISQ